MLYIGASSFTAGLSILGYMHADKILTIVSNMENVGIGLVGLGFCVGCVGLSTRRAEKKGSFTGRLGKNKAAEKPAFNFKLLNVNNSFALEQAMISQTCYTDVTQWLPESIEELTKLRTRELEQQRDHYLARQEELQERIANHEGSYQDFMNSLSPKVFVLDYTDPPSNQEPNRFAPEKDPRTRAERYYAHSETACDATNC